mmetsp:Transcript_27230/g.28303  ORF Transcript_27230/g.28303 Transcript_27230/m.28303 type:complete len:101 (-) Transcript_27230:2252-2554(-)
MSSTYVQPKDNKRLRACTRCKLLKTESQWMSERFCENCGDFREENITSNFKGFLAYTDPKHSWVSKWLVSQDVVPGLYCISVDAVEDEIEDYEQEEIDEQ